MSGNAVVVRYQQHWFYTPGEFPGSHVLIAYWKVVLCQECIADPLVYDLGLDSGVYSHLFNKRGGWNKRGGDAKNAKPLNVEVAINVEGGIFWKITST